MYPHTHTRVLYPPSHTPSKHTSNAPLVPRRLVCHPSDRARSSTLARHRLPRRVRPAGRAAAASAAAATSGDVGDVTGRSSAAPLSPGFRRARCRHDGFNSTVAGRERQIDRMWKGGVLGRRTPLACGSERCGVSFRAVGFWTVWVGRQSKVGLWHVLSLRKPPLVCMRVRHV